MSTYSSYSGGHHGISILTAIQIVFVVLKCTHLIDWPWTKVLIPLWINLGFVAIVLAAWLIALIVDR